MCPACEGRGGSEVIACPGARLLWKSCGACGGRGTMTEAEIAAYHERQVVARALREDRRRRRRTIAEEAAARGMDLVAYSRLERGY